MVGEFKGGELWQVIGCQGGNGHDVFFQADRL
jgi:hypothetical protein